MRLKISDDENESVALHDFIYHTTLPLISKDQGQTCLIGTGTLFKVAGKHFLVTAAHTLDHFEPAGWSYPAHPLRGEIRLLGPSTYYRIDDQTDDITVVELQSKETIAQLEKEWRFHTLDSIWLPDYSADSIIVAGYPSIRAKFDGRDLSGRMFVLKSQLYEKTPPEAFDSKDPMTPGVDFFVKHKDAINEVTGENVSMETLRGMSGSSIWAYRKRGWVSHRVWAPDNVFRIIGIQSAALKNNYVRGKAWTAAFKMMANMDESLREVVFRRVLDIARKVHGGAPPTENS
jgi:hypothetical protein